MHSYHHLSQGPNSPSSHRAVLPEYLQEPKAPSRLGGFLRRAVEGVRHKVEMVTAGVGKEAQTVMNSVRTKVSDVMGGVLNTTKKKAVGATALAGLTLAGCGGPNSPTGASTPTLIASAGEASEEVVVEGENLITGTETGNPETVVDAGSTLSFDAIPAAETIQEEDIPGLHRVEVPYMGSKNPRSAFYYGSVEGAEPRQSVIVDLQGRGKVDLIFRNPDATTRRNTTMRTSLPSEMVNMEYGDKEWAFPVAGVVAPDKNGILTLFLGLAGISKGIAFPLSATNPDELEGINPELLDKSHYGEGKVSFYAANQPLSINGKEHAVVMAKTQGGNTLFSLTEDRELATGLGDANRIAQVRGGTVMVRDNTTLYLLNAVAEEGGDTLKKVGELPLQFEGTSSLYANGNHVMMSDEKRVEVWDFVDVDKPVLKLYYPAKAGEVLGKGVILNDQVLVLHLRKKLKEGYVYQLANMLIPKQSLPQENFQLKAGAELPIVPMKVILESESAINTTPVDSTRVAVSNMLEGSVTLYELDKK